jgi:colanic acid/amylovoran biosynthesis glycosyltransferase
MSDHLRIGVFVNSFPVVSETFILRQVTGLLEMGHDVRIFADTPPDGSAPVHRDFDRFKLSTRTHYVDAPSESIPWELPATPLLGRTWPPGGSKSIANWRRLAAAFPRLIHCALRTPRLTRQVLDQRLYRYQAASLSGLYRLASLCRAPGGYDILHAHFGPVGNSYRFARSLWRAPLVVSFHGYDFSTRPRQDGPSLYHELFRTADLFTVGSSFSQTAVEKLGAPREKLQRLPVGFSLEDFPFRERTLQPGGTVRLLTIARLVPIKGLEYALRAIALLKSRFPALHYDIVGDGPLRESLQALTAELGLAGNVTFHGAQSGEVIANLLTQAHLFLLTSVNIEGDQEGQGLVLQEAQACGLPVVATEHGAFPEGLVDGKSGFLVPERDVDALAARLQWLISNAVAWPAIGKAGRAFVQDRYDIRKLNHRLLSLYADARQAYRNIA